SLAYYADQSALWAANEEALTVDGALATSSAGTTVRLLELDVADDTVTAGRQFAYEVESLHGAAISGARSGLADLVSMPDGSLLALERSAAGAFPGILNRVYEIEFAGATDISFGSFANGLDGETYASVAKELLWSGGIGNVFTGANMEGLTVGPRLPNGDWVLLGVVDNGGTGANTIASFVASPTTPIPFDADTADFDNDSSIDGGDFLAWQRGADVATLAGLAHGDANHDGVVTSADLSIWQGQYGNATTAAAGVPEPSSLAVALPLLAVATTVFRPSRR
ncbi:MAG: esterase-like activity of phytase family protein, partial [Planctomycetota bacterium]